MRTSALGALLSALLAAGCAAAPEPDLAVVIVDGKAYDYGDFEAFVARNVAQDPNALSDVALSALFEDFVDELCLLRLAEDAGDDARAAGSRSADDAPVTRDEALAYYRLHSAEFVLPERVVLGQALFQDESAAEKVREAVLRGKSLEEAAGAVDGAAFAGYQRDVTRADLPRAFSEGIFSMAEGELSEVLSADYGFHLFHVLEKLPEGHSTFEEAREEIERRIRAERSRQSSRNMLERARVRYNVELQPRNLPFELTPSSRP